MILATKWRITAFKLLLFFDKMSLDKSHPASVMCLRLQTLYVDSAYTCHQIFRKKLRSCSLFAIEMCHIFNILVQVEAVKNMWKI